MVNKLCAEVGIVPQHFWMATASIKGQLPVDKWHAPVLKLLEFNKRGGEQTNDAFPNPRTILRLFHHGLARLLQAISSSTSVTAVRKWPTLLVSIAFWRNNFRLVSVPPIAPCQMRIAVLEGPINEVTRHQGSHRTLLPGKWFRSSWLMSNGWVDPLTCCSRKWSKKMEQPGKVIEQRWMQIFAVLLTTLCGLNIHTAYGMTG